MTSQAAKGKHTRTSDHELANLAREGHTPDDISAATGITVAHIITRLRRLGLDNDGQPMVTPAPTREKVVTWLAGADEEWRADASCFTGGHDPELWFALPRFSADIEQTAKAICHDCPVRLKCLDSALKAEEGLSHQYRAGIFGGLTVNERMALKLGDAA